MSEPVDPGDEEGDEPAAALDIARILLRKDLFASARTDAQLADLVARAVATVPQAYSMLLCRLLGYYPRLPENESSILWARIVAHRAELAQSLGRPVHLRVAALDLIALDQMPSELGAPILLGPRVLRGLIGAVRP